MTRRAGDTRLHDWLDETVGQTPDPVEGARQVMSQIEETAQVGRWLPFPVLHRKARVKPPTTDHTTEYRPSAILATNGHSPTVIGRTRTMFSPVKAIVAGALVFALGGFFLIAQPFDQGGSVPGAEQGAEPAPGVDEGDWVLGATFSGTSDCAITGFGEVNDAQQRRGYVSECTVSTSDSRASGTNTIGWDSDCHAGIGCVGWGTFELIGPDGTWEGSVVSSSAGSGDEIRGMGIATGRGTGAYEGWTLIAYGATTDFANPFGGTFDGMIYLGDPPAMAVPPVES